jgi:hypothetical protein
VGGPSFPSARMFPRNAAVRVPKAVLAPISSLAWPPSGRLNRFFRSLSCVVATRIPCRGGFLPRVFEPGEEEEVQPHATRRQDIREAGPSAYLQLLAGWTVVAGIFGFGLVESHAIYPDWRYTRCPLLLSTPSSSRPTLTCVVSSPSAGVYPSLLLSPDPPSSRRAFTAPSRVIHCPQARLDHHRSL